MLKNHLVVNRPVCILEIFKDFSIAYVRKQFETNRSLFIEISIFVKSSYLDVNFSIGRQCSFGLLLPLSDKLFLCCCKLLVAFPFELRQPSVVEVCSRPLSGQMHRNVAFTRTKSESFSRLLDICPNSILNNPLQVNLWL